jgi:hypothetical protein
MNRLTIEYCKDYILNKLSNNAFISYESNKIIVITINKADRKIEIKITKGLLNRFTIDIIDNYGIIRIPKSTFISPESFENFIMDNIRKIEI